MIESLWVYDKKNVFDWNCFLEDQVGLIWTIDIAEDHICYIQKTLKINNKIVDIYYISAINFFYDRTFQIVSAQLNRFVYGFEHPDDPVYLEAGVQHKRIGTKSFYGRFKTEQEAIDHANNRIANIDQKYNISKENADKFPISPDEFDIHKKIFDAYIPWMMNSKKIHGFDVDELIMYNTYEDKVEEFYRITVPFVKVRVRKERKIFGLQRVLTEGSKNGLKIYIDKKDIGSIYVFMDMFRNKVIQTFLFELAKTEKKYGPQEIPNELYEEDEFCL